LGIIPTNGQLLIGNGTGYSLRTLTASTGITVTNGSGTISIANTGVLSFSGGATGLTPATSTTGAVTLAGTLAIASGGTNGFATPTAYGVAYGTGAAYAFTSAGTTGQVLTATTGSAPTWATPTTSGTVTSVAALTLGTTGTDLSSTVANSTTTPVITLNVPTASATNRGALSAADWTTFNSKGSGTVTSVATAGTVNGLTLTGGPITASGTVTLGGTLDLSSPPAIGGTTPAAGTFTTLTATGQASLGGDATNPSFRANAVAGSTRWIEAEGSVSGSVTLKAWSTSAAVGIIFTTRGATNFNFTTNASASNEQFRIAHTASAVNYVQVTGATTASKVVAISAQGSDTDVTLSLAPKGAGTIRFGTYTASALLAVAGYITITDSGGTSRRLLVG
jgi:hypothetical protein